MTLMQFIRALQRTIASGDRFPNPRRGETVILDVSEERVVYPGMLEEEAQADRQANGIPYHPEVIDWFTTTCASLGVAHHLG